MQANRLASPDFEISLHCVRASGPAAGRGADKALAAQAGSPGRTATEDCFCFTLMKQSQDSLSEQILTNMNLQ